MGRGRQKGVPSTICPTKSLVFLAVFRPKCPGPLPGTPWTPPPDTPWTPGPLDAPHSTRRKTRKIRQTHRSCMSSLRSCIQDCVRRTSWPSQVTSTFVMISLFLLVLLQSLKFCKLQMPQNVSKRLCHGFVTGSYTAASERSSAKKRVTGSRKRGSGIKNRHRSRTVSKTSTSSDLAAT